MSHFLFFLIPVALFAVLGVLGAGIYSLLRGGAFGERWSNKLMRLRVLAQAIAILLLIAFVWAVHNGH